MNLLQYILMAVIRFYRWVISPAKNVVFGPMAQCRFTPSCSAYALEAVQAHGAFAGSWLGVKRICRCHPWGGCGEDPVPLKQNQDVKNLNHQPSELWSSLDVSRAGLRGADHR